MATMPHSKYGNQIRVVRRQRFAVSPLRVLFVLALLSLLAACGGAPPAPAQPTAVPPAPTSAAAPTQPPAASAAPTALPVPPTPAPAQPTATIVAAQPTKPAAFGNVNAVPSGGKVDQGGNFATSGTYVSDLGFRSPDAGFPFQNYGGGNYVNLTPDEMRRFLGDAACASLADGKCILHPQYQQIMESWNQSMAGGHCYGFSVAALRFYQKQLNPADFGAATVADLKIDGNEKLQREIAYSFAFQFLPTVKSAMIGGTPNEVLDKLAELLKPGASAPDSYTIGFFKAEGGGGHAVTPYAVEDMGNGVSAVNVYDNNWPKATRAILFDRSANRWSYQASINPDVASEVYWGDATTKSLFLFPTNPGTKLLAQNDSGSCWMCRVYANGRTDGMAAPSAAGLVSQFNIIYLDRDAKTPVHLLITDDKGRRLGYLSDGKFVNEIPEAQVEQAFMDLPAASDVWNESDEPNYFIPVGMKFSLTIDGSLLKAAGESNVVMVGPGYDLGIDHIKLAPGQKDTLTLSSDGAQLSYKTASGESPDLIVGVQDKAADYEFFVKGVDLDGGGVINLGLALAKGQLSINTTGNQKAGAFGVEMDRITDKGEQAFTHDDDIILAPGDTAFLDFGKWQGDKSSVALEIDHKSDGSIDETIQLTDQ